MLYIEIIYITYTIPQIKKESFIASFTNIFLSPF
ncbi:hypothetical protein Q7M_1288 (plasmid) [Borrelia crocidurae str. Achema]|uniref:Uncharacterized protein n=1 Tax=Borrelia crocidurae (strain Achema) TaxID=1155096 RepID=I0FEY9_BORCA|nr:hypothetical protein Q7M_1288 [Borrelia crocidurae str. Achema]